MASEIQTADVRALLEQERAELTEQLAELGFADGGAGLNYDSNFADSSQVTAERGEAEALATTLKETLVEVEHALAKLDGNEFGKCEKCAKEISPARLEAMPASRFCIDCAASAR
ncbi:MAG TPA: TraR/DksA C4-type zinc finger protein [Acidimicrobiales bacterium]|nr:TraR/DksA C4-type zinc finger protein [Acidimicrobiales bacterium]